MVLSDVTYFSGEQINNLKRVFANPSGQKLLAVVATVHHQAVGKTLDNRAQRLPETLGGVAPSRMRHETRRLFLDRDVVLRKTKPSKTRQQKGFTMTPMKLTVREMSET